MLYEIIIRLYGLGILIASFFNEKAKLWVVGRRDWQREFARKFQKKGKTLWVHAASLGEFEQGRPLIESFRQQFPGWQIALTFFSPSGFEVRKNYPGADFIAYLPLDTRKNARQFLDLVQPDAAVFIKYEFWKNHLSELRRREIPTILISAVFRANQPFFKWYGGFWRAMLGCFSHVFVQTEFSKNLLQNIGFQNVTVAGDTRVDRVLSIAENAPRNEAVESFLKNSGGGILEKRMGQRLVLIAGSTWKPDEGLLVSVLQKPDFQSFKLILAPHEISPGNIMRVEKMMPSVRFSGLGNLKNFQNPARSALLIDNIGLLNTLYKYGAVAYIGGGFGKGIHNTLEPAAYGLPVIFGPNFQKFEEAKQLIERGGAFSVNDANGLGLVLTKLKNAEFYQKASTAAKGWLLENRGATARILTFLGQIQFKNL